MSANWDTTYIAEGGLVQGCWQDLACIPRKWIQMIVRASAGGFDRSRIISHTKDLCVYFKGIYSEEIRAVDGVNLVMQLSSEWHQTRSCEGSISPMAPTAFLTPGSRAKSLHCWGTMEQVTTSAHALPCACSWCRVARQIHHDVSHLWPHSSYQRLAHAGGVFP